MKKMISVHISEEKLSAIEMYLGQKNTTLAAELDKFIEQLYIKTVPQNVRDFIDMMSEKKPPRKSKAMQESEKKIRRSSNSLRFARECPVCDFMSRGRVNCRLNGLGKI